MTSTATPSPPPQQYVTAARALVDLKDEGVVVTSNRRTKKDAATDAATPTERPAESADVAR